MNWHGGIQLGMCYLRRHRGKAGLLVAAITLSVFLPLAILLTVRQAEIHLRARAESTPLLLGAAGSPLELVFNGLYFSKPDLGRLTMTEANAPGADGQAAVIPIYARYQARGYRIVGTSLDYFPFRQMMMAEGGMMTRLGDCVAGAEVARALNLKPGSSVISTPEQMFDIAGIYPLKMRVTGILAPLGGPDDRAIFTDLKTSWIIEGIAHGHQEPKKGSDTVLEDQGDNVALNASVEEYTEVTDTNVRSFHFHGDPGTFPVTGAIILPKDRKAETILLGRYQNVSKGGPQLIRPRDVMTDLFNTVFAVRNLVVAALISVGLASAVIAGLVFMLSNRLRAREFESLANLGAAQGSVRLLVAFEAGFVILTSIAISSILLTLVWVASPWILPKLTG